MNRWSWNVAQAGALVLLLVGTSPVWAADDNQSSLYGSSETSASPDPGYQGYQPAPGPTGNIIGYKPIPNDALGAAIPASQSGQAQLGATPAYPSVTPQGRTANSRQSQLPAAYLTGILGDGIYTLGRDDVIRINVRNQPEFSGDFAIDFNGRIQYNYLGDLPVAGLTKYEIQQVLERLLEKYVRVPSVNVQIVAYNSKVVYIIGEVGHPGKFIMRGDAIKLREAILAAGLPTHDAALGRVHVIKPDLNDPRIRVINMKPILYKGKLKDDVDLFPCEIVVVPSTVLSKVNDFLGTLLSPIPRAASVAALAAL